MVKTGIQNHPHNQYSWCLVNAALNDTSCSIFQAKVHIKLQSWPELLGHKGNKPVKMTYFLPPPLPEAMLMSGIQVIFSRLNIAWGKGGQKKWLLKQYCPSYLRGQFRVSF